MAPCATSPGEVVTNGWSPSKRNNPYANSGMVVQVGPEDWEPLGFEGPLGGLLFQQAVEQACWREAGQTQAAPAQRLKDFVHGRPSRNLPKTSYLPGVVPARLDQVLPDVVSRSLREGFKTFGRKMKGFLHQRRWSSAPSRARAALSESQEPQMRWCIQGSMGCTRPARAGDMQGGFCPRPWTADGWRTPP